MSSKERSVMVTIICGILILCILNTAAYLIEEDNNEKLFDGPYPDDLPKDISQTIIISGPDENYLEPTIIDYSTTIYTGSDGETITEITIIETDNEKYTTTNLITIDNNSSDSLSPVTNIIINLNGDSETITATGVQLIPTETVFSYSDTNENTISFYEETLSPASIDIQIDFNGSMGTLTATSIDSIPPESIYIYVDSNDNTQSVTIETLNPIISQESTIYPEEPTNINIETSFGLDISETSFTGTSAVGFPTETLESTNIFSNVEEVTYYDSSSTSIFEISSSTTTTEETDNDSSSENTNTSDFAFDLTGFISGSISIQTDASESIVTDSYGNIETTSLTEFSSESISVQTDADGNVVTDSNGNPVTASLTEFSSESILVQIDADGNVVTDSNGNSVTISSTETHTGIISVQTDTGGEVTDSNGYTITSSLTESSNESENSDDVITDSNGNTVTSSITGSDGENTSAQTDVSGNEITDSSGIVTASSTETNTGIISVQTDGSGSVLTDSNGNTVTFSSAESGGGSFSIQTDTSGNIVTEPSGNAGTLSSSEPGSVTSNTNDSENGDTVVECDMFGEDICDDSSTHTEVVTDSSGHVVSSSSTEMNIFTTGHITITDSNGNTVTINSGASNDGSISAQTDVGGNVVTDSSGNDVTASLVASNTGTISVLTDDSGNVVTDSNGNTITSSLTGSEGENISAQTDVSGNEITDSSGIVTASSTETNTGIISVQTDGSGSVVTDSNGNTVTLSSAESGGGSFSIQTDTSGNIVTEPSENAGTLSSSEPGSVTSNTNDSENGYAAIECEMFDEDICDDSSTHTEVVTDSSGHVVSSSSTETNILTTGHITITDSDGNIVTINSGASNDGSISAQTDVGGNVVTDSSGNAVTASNTVIISIQTDGSGSVVTDSNGNTVTSSSGASNGGSISAQTDDSGNLITDSSGNVVTFSSTSEANESTLVGTDSSGNSDIDLSGNDGFSDITGISNGSISVVIDMNGTYQYSETYYHIWDQTDFNIPLIQKTKNCPILIEKSFLQTAIAPVKTIGNALIWDKIKMNLMLVDQYGGEVLSYNTITGMVVKLSLIGYSFNGIIPTSVPNEYIVIVDNAIVLLQNTFTKDDLVMKYEKVLATFEPVWTLSVGRTDLQGRLWIAAKYKEHCMDYNTQDNLYMIHNGTAVIKEESIQIIGGMAWSNDSLHFYISDLHKGIIWDYIFEAKSGDLYSPTVLFDMKNHLYLNGVPNDVAVDSKGHIWTSLLGGTSVICIHSETGDIIEIISVPTHYPVSLAFGDELESRLYFTSAFAEYPTLNMAYTYAISNIHVKGINTTHRINTTSVFGKKKTLEIVVSKAEDCFSPHVNTYTPNYALMYNCKINQTLLVFNKKAASACGFLKDNITIQQVPINIETIGMSLHYDIKHNAIFFTDMYKPAVIKYTPTTATNVTVTFEGVTSVSSIIPVKHEKNYYVVSQDHHLVILEENFEKSRTVVKPYKETLASLKNEDLNIVFSIGKVDRQGRLWIGTKLATHNYKHECKLYCLHKRTLKVMETNITASGGMAWSKNYQNFYFADSGKGRIYKYKFISATPSITDRKPLFKIEQHPYLAGNISDIVVDNEGHIWATLYGGSAVLRVNTTSGSIAKVIAIPMKYPTTLTFGGALRDTLYVSSAKGVDCTVDNIPFTIVINNLGVVSGRLPTDRFVWI